LTGRIWDRLGADAALLLHFAFVAFAVLGGFLFLAHPVWAWVHVPAVLWSSVVNLADWTCPLTPVEKHLRRRAGGDSYEGGFVQHYVGLLVYPGGMPRRLEIVAGVSVIAWNGLVYAWLLTRG
jgi:hypothetical protein